MRDVGSGFGVWVLNAGHGACGMGCGLQGAAWGTFAVPERVASEHTVLLLDEVSTQHDVLPPLPVFTTHPVGAA